MFLDNRNNFHDWKWLYSTDSNILLRSGSVCILLRWHIKSVGVDFTTTTKYPTQGLDYNSREAKSIKFSAGANGCFMKTPLLSFDTALFWLLWHSVHHMIFAKFFIVYIRNETINQSINWMPTAITRSYIFMPYSMTANCYKAIKYWHRYYD